MSENETPQAKAPYIGQTADVLSHKTGADTGAAMISQKALFQRRGEIALYQDKLVIGDWNDDGDLVLGRDDIKAVRLEFTELYGRFIGGLLNAGKPLILETTHGELYLLINRKELMESTDDKRWAQLIEKWIAG
ncbi:hypothetical protein [Kutzneria sp. CA-103260]|uniref:hypothetical protein n=1 Tax=Kutzneria sp. CA-103260 TaxID=2802641 RepID=UPI001BA875FC|nr:hypothetical protein [Kutzneria sp. CA-103260]QUQ68675.1 hypothetical protein JJ691_64220 [Kutzneria sp. CA-103260]